MTKDEREDAFLEELKVLSEKYGVVVGACGCCQSPWLILREDITWYTEYTIPEIDALGWRPPSPEPRFSMDG